MTTVTLRWNLPTKTVKRLLCAFYPRNNLLLSGNQKAKQWLTTRDKLTAIFNHLSETKREEVLDFARFLYQKV
jgi:hypothetical protein